MIDRSVRLDLPDEVWKVIDTQFKPLSDESVSKILGNIIKNYVEEHPYSLDPYLLEHGHGLKDDIDIQEDMIMSLVELLERKGIGSFQEWSQIMHDRIMRE
jgi:hypothetical protein